MEAWRPKTETRLLRLNGRKPRLYLEVSDRIINMTPATLFLYHIIDLEGQKGDLSDTSKTVYGAVKIR